MEFELNRLKTFYLLPQIPAPNKYRLAKAGFFVNSYRLKQRIVCYHCNVDSDINHTLRLILNEHIHCSATYNKRNLKIQSPHTTPKANFPSDVLFEEFRMATFSNYNQNKVYDVIFLAGNLAKEGFYFFKEPNTIRCAYCNFILPNPKQFNLDMHSRSQTCLEKKRMMTSEIEKLELNIIEQNFKESQNAATTQILSINNTEPTRKLNTRLTMFGQDLNRRLKKTSEIEKLELNIIEQNFKASQNAATTQILSINNTEPTRKLSTRLTMFGQDINRGLKKVRFDLSAKSNRRQSDSVIKPFTSKNEFKNIPPVLLFRIRASSEVTQKYLREATAMGISQTSLKKFIELRYQTNVDPFENFSNFITRYFDFQETKPDLNCKYCVGGKVCILFKPCLHIITCQPCSQSLVKCPLCNEKILWRLPVQF